MPYFVQLTLSDAKGDQSVMSIPLPDATDVADAQRYGEEITLLLAPLVNGALRDARLSVPINYVPYDPVASIADVQEKARFSFRTTNDFLKSISIPTFVEGFFVPGTKEVDTTDPDVAAFTTAIIDGINIDPGVTDTIIQPCDVRGKDITELEGAVEAWGRARG